MDTKDAAWFRAFSPRRSGFSICCPPLPAAAGALALQGMLRGGEETPYSVSASSVENDADNITREVLTAVRRTFITRFEPRRYQEPDHLDGRCHRPDAADATAVILFEVRYV